MTIAVDMGRKATKTNKQTRELELGFRVSFICIVVGQGYPTRGPE